MVQHFLSDSDLGEKKYWELLKLAQQVKKKPKKYSKALAGKNVAMLFAKNSTRTRVSFEVGIDQLGGNAIFLSSNETQLGRGETIHDTSKVLSGYADCIVARLFAHSEIEELARYSRVPVVNALTDLLHPCQALGDLLTILEKKKKFNGTKLAYVGNANNNVTHSLMIASGMVGLNLSVGCANKTKPNESITRQAIELHRQKKSVFEVTHDSIRSVQGADFVYTDAWYSMGEDSTKLQDRFKALKPFQVNRELMSHAKSNAWTMHDLPAHRGVEITDEMMDWNRSAIWDQAENRLHAQKALLIALLGKR